MKRVLVTGGLGFIGSHLVDRLLEEGCQVTLVDNLLSNTMQPADYSDRCKLMLQPIEEALPELRKAEPFHEIYHLASVVGPAAVLKHAGKMAASVIMSTEACFELALLHKAPLIIASTSEVYGRRGKMSETDECHVSPNYTVRQEYALAKLTTEIAAVNRARVTDLRVNVIRPFNVTGPRQLPTGGFVLPRFVVAALTGQPLTVFGDGQQVRAFTDVRDIVTGLLKVMRSQHRSLVLNFGTPANELSMLNLANKVKDIARSASSVDLVDPKQLFGPLYEEGIERVPVVERTQQALDWTPSIPVDKTIADTLDWYRTRPDLLKLDLTPKASVNGAAIKS